MNDPAELETTEDGVDATTAALAETTESNAKGMSTRAATKMLNFTIGYLFSVLSACAIMMWSFFNTWLNVLEYNRTQQVDDQNWKLAFVVVFFTGVIPFLFGLILLFRSLGSTKR